MGIRNIFMKDTDPEKVTYIGETDSRNKRKVFGIKAKDRSRHTYVIGKTGMGKSTLLENMAVQDIRNGEGLAFIDPHGKSADLLLEYVPKERMQDVIYFAPFDVENPIAFNVMEDVGYDKRHLVMSGLMSAFKKIWVDAWSARMEYILGNTLLALLEYPGSTLLSINRMFSDKEYRKKVVDNVTDSTVKAFWEEEFAKYTDRFAAEATPAIQNKVGQFTANPLIRNIIGQSTSSFDLRKAIDDKSIFIVNLSKGRIGEVNANLLGSILITKLYLSAMSRADTAERELRDLPNFFLYVDEFQSFANESFADILSEARKYKLNLTVAHQYIEQMAEEVKEAVFGNVGTMISFRVGAYDAEVLEKEFAPKFTAEDLVNLGFAQIYLKLMIDGISSAPFSAVTLPPIEPPEISVKQDIIEYSRKKYSYPRAEVEDYINKWYDSAKENISKGEGGSSGNDKSKNKNKNKIPPKKKAPPKDEKETEDVGEELRNALSKGKKSTDKSTPVTDDNKTELREALASLAMKESFSQKREGKGEGSEKKEDKGKEAGDKTESNGKEEKNDSHNSSANGDFSNGKNIKEVSKSELERILNIEEEGPDKY
ncbi:MAG: type IV secretory system conjugative DNA transfer family protein [Patescibacteria group bacterium]